MAEPVRKQVSTSYARDLTAWSEEQGRLLRSRSAALLDWDHLAEEIEELGSSGRNEIRNRMTVLLLHLLKWQFQPDAQDEQLGGIAAGAKAANCGGDRGKPESSRLSGGRCCEGVPHRAFERFRRNRIAN